MVFQPFIDTLRTWYMVDFRVVDYRFGTYQVLVVVVVVVVVVVCCWLCFSLATSTDLYHTHPPITKVFAMTPIA